jgi:hypothetical protein
MSDYDDLLRALLVERFSPSPRDLGGATRSRSGADEQTGKGPQTVPTARRRSRTPSSPTDPARSHR